MKINISYFAILQDQRGQANEVFETLATTPSELYQELQKLYGFTLTKCRLKVAVNDKFADWQTVLQNGDKVVFIPPVAGG